MSKLRIDRSRMSSARAFTLIELLVVISIISLLVSILLPALQGARKSAEKVQCANHERQLFIGLSMYSIENKEYVLPHRNNIGMPETYWCRFTNSGNYRWGVNVYVTDSRAFLCPTTQLDPFSTSIYTNYAINGIASLNPASDTFSPFMLTYLPGYRLIRRDDLKQPAKTIAFIDAAPVSYAPTLSQWTTSTTTNSGYWHNEAANTVLNDGHVDSVQAEDSTGDIRWFDKRGLTFRTVTGL